MTKDERLNELLKQRSEIEKQIRELTVETVQVGRAVLQVIPYKKNKPTNYQIKIKTKWGGRNITIVENTDRNQINSDLRELIDNLNAVYEKFNSR